MVCMTTEEKSLQYLKEINKNLMNHPQSIPTDNAKYGPSMIFAEGDGIRFTDMEGKSYIDGIAQLWNVNLGHGTEELAQVAYDQMKTFAYGSQFYSNSKM